MTPLNGIVKHLKAMEKFEPLQLTADEQAIFEFSKKEQRKFHSAKLAERTTKLESIFK